MNKHDRKLAILVHKNPDNDALGSAHLIKAWYAHEKGYRPENIIISGQIDFLYLYKDILDDQTLHSTLDKSWTDYDVCIVDTRTPRFLDKPQKFILKGASQVTIYDHHISSAESFKSYLKDDSVPINYHCDPNAESCCEYIYGLMGEDMRKKLSVSNLNACLLGMYSDSSYFINSSEQTLNTATDLIKRGASIRCITHSCNKDIGMWGKLKYLGKIPQSIMWMKDSKIAIIKTSFSDYSECNKTIDKSPANNRAPLYILSVLKKERIKYSKTIHAYLLVYDKEWVNTSKRYVLVLDLIKWSPKRQEALQKLGFVIHNNKQTRYYFCACNNKYFGICKDIDRVMIETHDTDLEDVYEGTKSSI